MGSTTKAIYEFHPSRFFDARLELLKLAEPKQPTKKALREAEKRDDKATDEALREVGRDLSQVLTKAFH